MFGNFPGYLHLHANEIIILFTYMRKSRLVIWLWEYNYFPKCENTKKVFTRSCKLNICMNPQMGTIGLQ